MSRIGVFSDDCGGLHLALLAGHGLAEAGTAITVAAAFSASDCAAHEAHSGLLTLISTGGSPLDRATEILGRAFRGDILVALPLAALDVDAIRSRLDVVVTVGRDRSVAARSLSCARYDTADRLRHGREVGERTPAWFLASDGQSALRSAAMAASRNGPALPFAVRALPASMPRLDPRAVGRLIHDYPDPAYLRCGLLIAALLLAIAADPYASGVGPAEITALMLGDLPTARTPDVPKRLADIAAALARVAGWCNGAAPKLSPRRRMALSTTSDLSHDRAMPHPDRRHDFVRARCMP